MKKQRYPEAPLLLVDDEKNWLQGLAFSLKSSAGINHLLTCDDSREVLKILEKIEVSAILLDLNMPHLSGTQLLEQLTQDYPQIPVIILSGLNQLETAVACMKQGAFDYFVKSTDMDRLNHSIARALSFKALQQENSDLRQRFMQNEAPDLNAMGRITSQNPQVLTLCNYLQSISASREPVLIIGESGVGKDLFAEAVHKLSCPEAPWVPVNTAGLDDNVFADTLFGHVKGAFTGAEQQRAGMIELAAGGTLFLDEIGDLSLSSQVKLLRFLQSGEYYPVGSDRAHKSSARLVFATNQDLTEKQNSGQFRKDLYYRLKSHQLAIPPLRERLDDLPLLVDFFLTEAATALAKKRPTPPPELFDLLKTYNFPGNIRELRSMIHNAVSTHSAGRLSLKTFKQAIDPQSASHSTTDDRDDDVDARLLFSAKLPSLKAAADQLVREAMRRATGNQTLAARLLGITQPSLNRRLKNLSKD